MHCIIKRVYFMNLLNFISTFPDGANCRLKWKSIRDKQGVKCPDCGNMKHIGNQTENVTNAKSTNIAKVCAPIR
jgi:hypothetical protein